MGLLVASTRADVEVWVFPYFLPLYGRTKFNYNRIWSAHQSLWLTLHLLLEYTLKGPKP